MFIPGQRWYSSTEPELGLGTELIDKQLPMPRSIFADLAWWPTINLCYTPKIVREARRFHQIGINYGA